MVFFIFSFAAFTISNLLFIDDEVEYYYFESNEIEIIRDENEETESEEESDEGLIFQYLEKKQKDMNVSPEEMKKKEISIQGKSKKGPIQKHLPLNLDPISRVNSVTNERNLTAERKRKRKTKTKIAKEKRQKINSLVDDFSDDNEEIIKLGLYELPSPNLATSDIEINGEINGNNEEDDSFFSIKRSNVKCTTTRKSIKPPERYK